MSPATANCEAGATKECLAHTYWVKAVQQLADVRRFPLAPAPTEREFADLLQPLVGPGYRLALAMLHDREAAEDAVQEASFTTWQKLGKAGGPVSMRAWFLGVVANKCRNARRGLWARRVSVGLPEELAVTSGEDQTLRRADLRRAVSRLSYDEQLVLVLYFYLDMPLDEVAVVARSTVSATRSRLYRAIARLRPGIDVEEELT